MLALHKKASIIGILRTFPFQSLQQFRFKLQNFYYNMCTNLFHRLKDRGCMLSTLWLQNTLYVVIFIILCREGLTRLKDRVFHLSRLALTPCLLLWLSIQSLMNDLGMLVGHVALFISGLCIITFFAFKNMHLSILIVCPSSRRIVLAGSLFPLFLYLLIFVIKYLSATLLSASVTFSQNSILLGILSLLYGSICGWFTGLFFLTCQQIYRASAIPLHRAEQ